MHRTAIVVVILSTILSSGVCARVWNVNATLTGNAPTIQAAIDSCAGGDTVLVAPGTYTGDGNRDIDFTGKAILVMSASGAAATIIECAGSEGEPHRGFYFHSGEDTTSVLRGFTITNGSMTGGGAIRCIGASPKIVENVVTGNYSRGSGGGIYCEGTHSIISGNTVSNNQTMIWLAAADNAAAERALASMRNSTATAFEGPSGGNICCVGDSSRIELNTITGGKSTNGSAIYCENSFIRVWNNNISENGGAYTERTVCFVSGSYDIEANEIVDNRTWHDGAGLYCSGGAFRVAGNTIRENCGHGEASGTGGGIYCGGGSFTIENNDIRWNWNNGAGGIYIQGSGVVRDNLIRSNQAEHAGACVGCLAALYGSSLDVGGGILIDGSTSLLVTGNTITGNYASWGGGIACLGGTPEIRGNIIAHNSASHNGCSYNGDQDGKGGGIYCEDSSPVVIGNTIYSNSANNEISTCRGGAGIHYTGTGSPTFARNIVVSNNAKYALGIGGIYCEGTLSAPSVSCNDVYGNANANYGGTLGDRTGQNGNFSLDPLFCDAENGNYELHIVSPCTPGHHPGGEDCGLIGALGPVCDFMATLLQGYSTNVEPSAVTITWTLAEAGENLRCAVLRAEGADGEYLALGGSGIARDGLTFTCRDASFDPGTAYRYRVDVVDDEGSRVLFETGEIATPSLPLTLDQNFPNPFNPSTAIVYYLPEDSKVSLVVYDVTGRMVAGLVDRSEQKGRHSVIWDGRDARGATASSGIYFYRLTAGKETISRKMILLR